MHTVRHWFTLRGTHRLDWPVVCFPGLRRRSWRWRGQFSQLVTSLVTRWPWGRSGRRCCSAAPAGQVRGRDVSREDINPHTHTQLHSSGGVFFSFFFCTRGSKAKWKKRNEKDYSALIIISSFHRRFSLSRMNAIFLDCRRIKQALETDVTANVYICMWSLHL